MRGLIRHHFQNLPRESRNGGNDSAQRLIFHIALLKKPQRTDILAQRAAAQRLDLHFAYYNHRLSALTEIGGLARDKIPMEYPIRTTEVQAKGWNGAISSAPIPPEWSMPRMERGWSRNGALNGTTRRDFVNDEMSHNATNMSGARKDSFCSHRQPPPATASHAH